MAHSIIHDRNSRRKDTIPGVPLLQDLYGTISLRITFKGKGSHSKLPYIPNSTLYFPICFLPIRQYAELKNLVKVCCSTPFCKTMLKPERQQRSGRTKTSKKTKMQAFFYTKR